MQINPSKLIEEIGNYWFPIFLIFGDEPYQKFKVLDSIRLHANNQGFTERTSLVADTQFDWAQLMQTTQSMSLFSDRQIIELELPTGKPGKDGAKSLQAFSELNSDDILLVLHGPRISKDIQKSKWFTSLLNKGCYSPCFSLEGKALTNWIQLVAAKEGCQIDTQATALLSEYCEGNMLAGAQEIKKLFFLYGNKPIGAKDIDKVVVNQSRYNVFQIVDIILDGNGKQTTKRLLSLEGEGVEPVILLWALIKEWQTLTELKASNQAINWNAFRIWGTRKRYYERALMRLSKENLSDIGRVLGQAEIVFKSQVVIRPYILICHLCLMFIFPQLAKLKWSI